jgi:hypothetical protein
MNNARKLLANSFLAKLTPGAYLLFVDRSTTDVDALIRTEMPAGVDIVIIPLRLADGQSITNAVWIERLDMIRQLDAMGEPK